MSEFEMTLREFSDIMSQQKANLLISQNFMRKIVHIGNSQFVVTNTVVITHTD
jgi:hypothetical protein